MGDKHHPKLNISRMPIANKYREGKMKENPEKGTQKNVKSSKGKR